MKLEQFALNVKKPLAMTQWYVDNLGMQVVRQQEQSPYTTFLADDSGQIMIEIYNHPAASIPDYSK